MSLDVAKVGEITAELMDDIEAQHPNATFEDAVVVIEVSVPDEDGERYTINRFSATTHRASTLLGMLHLTREAVSEPWYEPDE